MKYALTVRAECDLTIEVEADSKKDAYRKAYEQEGRITRIDIRSSVGVNKLPDDDTPPELPY